MAHLSPTRRRWHILAIGTAVVLLLTACAEPMFFHPDTRIYTTPEQLGIQGVQAVRIPGPDGQQLDGLWLPARTPVRGTVLQVHGNAANLSNHLPLVSWLPDRGYNVLAFDYRGFGTSTGSPSLDGIVADTVAAMDWLRQRPDVKAQGLVVLGQSLGGATATRAVVQSPEGVRQLVLDSPLSSYRGMARDTARRGPWLLRWLAPLVMMDLPDEPQDPLQAIGQLRVPLVVLVGTEDRVVPPAHGEALWAAAPGPKTLEHIAGGQHIDALTREPVRAWLLAQLAQLAQQQPANGTPGARR